VFVFTTRSTDTKSQMAKQSASLESIILTATDKLIQRKGEICAQTHETTLKKYHSPLLVRFLKTWLKPSYGLHGRDRGTLDFQSTRDRRSALLTTVVADAALMGYCMPYRSPLSLLLADQVWENSASGLMVDSMMRVLNSSWSRKLQREEFTVLTDVTRPQAERELIYGNGTIEVTLCLGSDNFYKYEFRSSSASLQGNKLRPHIFNEVWRSRDEILWVYRHEPDKLSLALQAMARRWIELGVGEPKAPVYLQTKELPHAAMAAARSRLPDEEFFVGSVQHAPRALIVAARSIAGPIVSGILSNPCDKATILRECPVRQNMNGAAPLIGELLTLFCHHCFFSSTGAPHWQNVPQLGVQSVSEDWNLLCSVSKVHPKEARRLPVRPSARL
jgi:hypothetical protein